MFFLLGRKSKARRVKGGQVEQRLAAKRDAKRLKEQAKELEKKAKQLEAAKKKHDQEIDDELAAMKERLGL